MTPKKTAKEISDAIIAQLETSLNTSIPLLPKSFCRVLAKVLGGVYVSLYQFAGWILLQMFVKTASNKPVTINGRTITPLKMHGELVDIHQKTGQRAERTVQITVLTQGGTIPSGARIANPDTQMIYVVVGDVQLSAPTVTALIRATKPGVLGNVDVGTKLHFVSAPDSVEKEVEVIASGQLGVDPEITEEYRERIRERWLAWPQGGAYADYKHWAEGVVGVKNAYPYSGWGTDAIPDSRAGQVFIYIESADGDGIPNGTLLGEVHDHVQGDSIGLANRRNINAHVKILPITRTIFDVEISGLATTEDDLVPIRTAIEDGLKEYMLDRQPGGQVGYTLLPPRKDFVTDLSVGGVAARIAASFGGTVAGAAVSVGGIRDPEHYLQEGEKAKLGTITWS